VHSSDAHDYLQQGLADMLVARLGRDPRLAVIEVAEAEAATTDAEAARAAGQAAGGAWVVFGSFTRFGEGASLDLQLARVGGDAGLELRRAWGGAGEGPQQVCAHATSLGGRIPMLDGVSERITSRVLGVGAGPAAVDAAQVAGGAPVTSSELAELRRRVEAL